MDKNENNSIKDSRDIPSEDRKLGRAPSSVPQKYFLVLITDLNLSPESSYVYVPRSHYQYASTHLAFA